VDGVAGGTMTGVPVSIKDEKLVEHVRALREQGRSPKQIARSLGLPPAMVARLVRAVAAHDQASAAEPEVVGCWVSAGWSRGLTVNGHPDWADIEDAEDGPSGVACLLIARRGRGSRVSVCGYLVDVYCLGVKNAIGPEVMPERDLYTYRRWFFGAFPDEPLEVPTELAQHLAFGAAEYARSLGFDPHPDFEATASHLGSWIGPSAIEFGRDGMPYYVEGPYDNGNRILGTLNRTVGRDNFHFLVGAGAL
jgi:hypothetical protein